MFSLLQEALRRRRFWRELKGKAWVVTDRGQLAVIDHTKRRGLYGVRPVDAPGVRFFLSPNEHWSAADRVRIPLEFTLSVKQIRVAEPEEIPVQARESTGWLSHFPQVIVRRLNPWPH